MNFHSLLNILFQEKQIKAIADSGAKVVVSGGKIGDMALHFLNKYGVMAVRLTRYCLLIFKEAVAIDI